MDVSYPVEQHCWACPKEDSKQNHRNESKHINYGTEEAMQVGLDSIDIDQPRPSPEDAMDCGTNLRSDGIPEAATNNSGTPSDIEKKVNSKIEGKKYTLRPSLESSRVLRSRSNRACNTPPTNTSTNSINPTTQRRRNRKKRKGVNIVSNDELAKIRKRVKYLSARMNYEQSLIEAYSCEGWKGQRFVHIV